MLPLHTERLTVRMMRAGDVPRLVAYRNEPGVARHQEWALPFTDEAAQHLVEAQARLDGPSKDHWVQLAIEHDGVAVGDVAVGLDATGTVASLGYTLAPEHQGSGLATEAVAGVIDALCEAGVHRFVATIDPENVASMRVAEAAGFTFECLVREGAQVRGQWVDDVHYSMLAADRQRWRSRDRRAPDDVQLVEITPDDAHLWGRLATHHSQQRFVAPMANSFRDALFPEVVDGAPLVPWMRGIEADGERVGFVMTAEVTAHHPEPYLWRLLVDRMHQRRGIGERALGAIIDRLRVAGQRSLLTSWVDGPGSPRPFYERLGFRPTGEILDGEIVGRLELPDG